MKIAFLFLMAIILISCGKNEGEYKKFDNSLAYKIIELGDGGKLENQEYLFLNIEILDLNRDTIYYVPAYDFFLPIKNSYLDSVFKTFEIGDLLELKIKKNKLLQFFNFIALKEYKGDLVLLKVKFLDAVSKDEVDYRLKKSLSKRELEEELNLKEFLNSTKIPFEKKNGIYRFQDVFTKGEQIKYGSEVSIHYKGKFLNGYTFDDTFKKNITPSFTFGHEFQMLDGIYKGISGMREGEKVKLILPSRHAFGDGGSLAAIVPPYTAVIYEVNIEKVIN